MNLKPQPKSSSLARSPALHSAFDDRRSTIDGGGSSIFPSFRHHERAFTMVEIAISLAVIGFALVAIIGILPTGMQVSKDNRQETVINQDMTLFLDAIRNGEKGLDDLTNYVTSISILSTELLTQGKGRTFSNYYTFSNSFANGSPMTPSYPITNGLRIIGLLSTPKYEPYETISRGSATVNYFSNQVIAYVRSMSGAASEKVPQADQSVHELTFTYRMTSDIVPYSNFNRDWLEWTNYSGAELAWRSNYFIFARNLQTNLYDVRLLFRWPILPNGNTGEGRQPYRTMMGGYLMLTNEPGFPGALPSPYRLHFFEPRTYVKAQ